MIALVLVCAIVMVLHVAVVLGRSAFEPEGSLRQIMAIFDAGSERTLASWWTSTMLAGAAVAALVVGQLAASSAAAAASEVRAWRVLAVMFGLLSLDEAVSLHERGSDLTSTILDASSPLIRFGWILPATAVIVFSLAVLIPAFRVLPSRPRALIVAGLGIAVAGALGMELVHVLMRDAGAGRVWRHLVMIIEESAELGGIVLILAGVSLAVTSATVDGRVALAYRARGLTEAR